MNKLLSAACLCLTLGVGCVVVPPQPGPGPNPQPDQPVADREVVDAVRADLGGDRAKAALAGELYELYAGRVEAGAYENVGQAADVIDRALIVAGLPTLRTATSKAGAGTPRPKRDENFKTATEGRSNYVKVTRRLVAACKEAAR